AYDFGFVDANSSATTTFTVTNDGTAASNQLHLTGGLAPFALSNDNCASQTLAPGGACTFDLTFTWPLACPFAQVHQTLVQIDGGPTVVYIDLDAQATCA